MNYKDVIKVLKANPDISLDEAKKQALEAGVSTGDFYNAWKKANSKFHEKRILEIINILNSRDGGIGTDELKKEFKPKGYLDDEIDLAAALQYAQIKTGPFSSIVTVFLILILGIAITTLVNLIFGLGEDILNISFFIILFGEIAYMGYIGAQMSKYFGKILASDFNGEELRRVEAKSMLDKWKANGASYLKRSNGRFHQMFKIEYDGRPTYFSNYTYTIGSGKNRRSYTYLFVVQKTHKSFPSVQCYKNSMHFTSFIHGKDIQLEGIEFNKLYKINSTDKESDAYYVFNPRLMSALIEKEKVDEVFLFETVGDEIMVGFKQMGSAGSIFRTKQPIIKYADYKREKDHLIKCLDIATDLNDVLCREIVDAGDKRSVAKEI
ncbi:DUF3137 domain-containing protein [Candidatus Peregrinibacteria bacterium]|nr:DUF3137 domain-containing protein [Candidatus Peregrinibacteria bacterium]